MSLLQSLRPTLQMLSYSSYPSIRHSRTHFLLYMRSILSSDVCLFQPIRVYSAISNLSYHLTRVYLDTLKVGCASIVPQHATVMKLQPSNFMLAFWEASIISIFGKYKLFFPGDFLNSPTMIGYESQQTILRTGRTQYQAR